MEKGQYDTERGEFTPIAKKMNKVTFGCMFAVLTSSLRRID